MMHILFFVFSNKNKISINFNFKKSNLQTIKIFINRHDNCYLKRDNIYLKRDNLSERTSRGGGGWGAGQGRSGQDKSGLTTEGAVAMELKRKAFSNCRAARV